MKWFNSDFIKETDIKNEFRINIKKMVPMLDDKWCFWDGELEKFVILFEDEAVTEDLKKKFQVFFKKNNWSEGDVIVYHSMKKVFAHSIIFLWNVKVYLTIIILVKQIMKVKK
mgnify:CR=1 FL=1